MEESCLEKLYVFVDITNSLCCLSPTFAVNQRKLSFWAVFSSLQSQPTERKTFIDYFLALKQHGIQSNSSCHSEKCLGNACMVFYLIHSNCKMEKTFYYVYKDLDFSMILLKHNFCLSKCAKTQYTQCFPTQHLKCPL